MIGIDFKYNGQDFSETLFDKVTGQGIKLTDVTWHNLVTTDDQNNRQGEHGIDVSATFIRGRVISISGEIHANSRSKRNKLMQSLQNTFSPPNFPNVQNRGFHNFEFTDDDGLDWIIVAKMTRMPAYDPRFDDFTITPFTVQLIAEDESIFGTVINQVNHSEGFYGGNTLPNFLPNTLDDYGIAINLINSGTWKAALKTTITANQPTGPNMRVVNTATDQFIGVQTPLAQGDVLVIDTFDNTILKNGTNFSADRITGSIFHFLQPGDNSFIVRDDAQIIGDGLSVDVSFEWRNTKI